MGIITNGPAAGQNVKIDALGIRHKMTCIIISEAVGVKKPDERIFRMAVDTLNVAPSEAWYVGDHPINDVLAAAAAGWTAIWLRGRHPWPDGHPEPAFQIDSLEELLAVIGRARNRGFRW
jgi:putative hydrolase of the HAD superfamily